MMETTTAAAGSMMQQQLQQSDGITQFSTINDAFFVESMVVSNHIEIDNNDQIAPTSIIEERPTTTAPVTPVSKFLTNNGGTARDEDSPIEKMFKNAISNVQEVEPKQQLLEAKQQEYKNTALFQQLDRPIIKRTPSSSLLNPVVSGVGTPTATSPMIIATDNFDGQFHSIMSSMEVQGPISDFTTSTATTSTAPTAPVPVAAKPKRQTAKRPPKAKAPTTPKKQKEPNNGKILKSTTEIINELEHASQQIPIMENFDLNYLYDHEITSDGMQLGNHIAPSSSYPGSSSSTWTVNSPDKNSGNNLFPQYSEEIPTQQYSTNGSQQQQQQYNNDSTQTQRTLYSHDIIELNRKLLKEVAILRLFIRSQKLRIETLAKQNDSYRKMLQQNSFQQELSKIEAMFSTSECKDVVQLVPLSSTMFDQYRWGS